METINIITKQLEQLLKVKISLMNEMKLRIRDVDVEPFKLQRENLIDEIIQNIVVLSTIQEKELNEMTDLIKH